MSRTKTTWLTGKLARDMVHHSVQYLYDVHARMSREKERDVRTIQSLRARNKELLARLNGNGGSERQRRVLAVRMAAATSNNKDARHAYATIMMLAGDLVDNPEWGWGCEQQRDVLEALHSQFTIIDGKED